MVWSGDGVLTVCEGQCTVVDGEIYKEEYIECEHHHHDGCSQHLLEGGEGSSICQLGHSTQVHALDPVHYRPQI